MPTNTQGRPARELSSHQVNYLRKTVNYNDPGIATGIPVRSWLPEGAQILRTVVTIQTVFNAQTTNVLTVGTNASSYNNIVASGDVDETVLGATTVLTGAKLNALSADKQVYVMYTQTGTAATTGKASIVIEYAPDNDE